MKRSASVNESRAGPGGWLIWLAIVLGALALLLALATAVANGTGLTVWRV